MAHAEWVAEGTSRFGTDDPLEWLFVCPVCGHVAKGKDWKDVGAPPGAVAFSCVGRWLKACRDAFSESSEPGPCNYAGGGLFQLNPVSVVMPDGQVHQAFEFAESAG